MTFWIIVAIAVGIGIILGRKNIARLFSAGRAQGGRIARAAQVADPIAMYQQKIDAATDKLQSAQKGVEQFKGLIRRVGRQVADGEERVEKLTTRCEYFAGKDMDNELGEEAMRLEEAEADLVENRSQLEQYNARYEEQLKDMQQARRDILEAKEKAKSLNAKLELSKAEKACADLNSELGVDGLSDPLDGLGAAEAAIQSRIDQNRASADVSSDLNADSRRERKIEEDMRKDRAKSRAAELKARFAKKTADAPAETSA